MKISNLHIRRDNGYSYMTVDISTNYTNGSELWFSVPSEYEEWLTDDVYDAFLVAAIYPAMFYGEPIQIEGKVSHRLYDNIVHYAMPVAEAYRDYLHSVEVSVTGFADAKKIGYGAATGFSGGIDSFCTFVDRYVNEGDKDVRITSLFMFNVGSHGGGGNHAREVFHNRYNLLKSFPDEVKLPYVPLDSNLFDFYQDHWEYEGGHFCRVAAALLFQKKFSRWYLSSSHAYKEWMEEMFDRNKVDLTSVAEAYLSPLLSTNGMEIVTDGSQYYRTEKTERIVGYKPAQRLLNVCVNHWGESTSAANCGRCTKCKRTLLALDVMGKLDEFDKVFDIVDYRKNRRKYWYECIKTYDTDVFSKDIVEFAKRKGYKGLPTIREVKIYELASRCYHPIWWIMKKTGIKK